MHIASRLRQTTLGDLLASLHRAGASGVLELIEPHTRHAIHLRRGFVQAVESNAAAMRLGDVATRVQGVSRPIVERARMFAQQRGLRIGQALVATNAIRPSDLDALLAAQQRERLDRLFVLADAELRFHVARPLPAGASEQNPLPARDVFYGRPRKAGRTGHAKGADTRSAPRAPPQSMAAATSPAHTVLGVTADAQPTAIRHAFKRLVFELHPDRAPGASNTERAERSRRLIAVVDAYRSIERTGRACC